MIMENGRVRSWYKWVEENRQPATLRRPGKGEGSGIVYDLSKQFLRRPWFIHRIIKDEKSRLFQRSLQQLSEITHNWSRGLTDRHFVQLANCLFNDISRTASSKLISNRAFILSFNISFEYHRGEKFAVAKMRAEILLVSSMMRNVTP